MSDQSLQLVHEFTFQVACGPPHEVGDGPYGSRQYFEMTSGRVEGPRLKGKLLGAGSDWMLTGPDGFIRMDVRVQIETDDGAILCAHYFGPAEANEKLKRAMGVCAPTEFADQSIRSHWVWRRATRDTPGSTRRCSSVKAGYSPQSPDYWASSTGSTDYLEPVCFKPPSPLTASHS